MWQPWSQVNNTPIPAQPVIYLGCMTGTSVDRYADFTAVIFDDQGKPIAYRNTQVQIIPSALLSKLLSLSTCQQDALVNYDIATIERQFTVFLAKAYQQVIAQFSLTNYPQEKIILSPHGQTILHKPEQNITRQLLDGPFLSPLTGYSVVHSHRQACLQVSHAAPLAPV